MIAAWRASSTSDDETQRAIPRALTLFCGGKASVLQRGSLALASAPPGRTSPSVEPPCDSEAGPLAFDGWIDDAPEVGGGDARTYATLIARRGDATEPRIAGHYAAAQWETDGTLRLARSPWRAPPLHYGFGPAGPVAASVLRVLFAGGVPKLLDHERVADALYFDAARQNPGSWYRGIAQVPLGSIVRIRPDGRVETRQWYDPHALVPLASGKPDDWLDQARELLDRAGAHAARRSRRPAITLSGGLDSPLAAAAVLRHRGTGCHPFAVTSRPDADWDGRIAAGKYGDEGPFAAAFCARHDLALHTTHGGGFDRGLDDFYRATDMTTMQIGNAGPLHALWQTARDQGADGFFDAVIGNDTISADGSWSYAEDLRRGHWRQLRASLASRPADTRAGWRKFAALAVLPQFPGGLQRMVRSRWSRRGPDFAAHASLLRPEAIAEYGMEHRARANLAARLAGSPSRRDLVSFAWAASDAGLADFNLGMEQLYGPRHRDVLAYRPLIEFALQLPTRAFVQDGSHRWLARELLRGVTSDEQRLNPLYGAHNVDWFLQLSQRRATLRAQAAHIADHPLLGELVDTNRMLRLIADWPAETPLDAVRAWPLSQGLLNTYCLARFVGHVEGRNDL